MDLGEPLTGDGDLLEAIGEEEGDKVGDWGADLGFCLFLGLNFGGNLMVNGIGITYWLLVSPYVLICNRLEMGEWDNFLIWSNDIEEVPVELDPPDNPETPEPPEDELEDNDLRSSRLA